MVSIGPTADIGMAGRSCNQSIRTAQAAQPQKVHQKEEKGSAAEAAACNKSAAGAASPDYVKLQDVIKSAASAASRKTKNQGTKV